MKDKELKVSREKVLKAAGECEDFKEVAKTLWPDEFGEESITPTIAICPKEEWLSIYLYHDNYEFCIDPVSIDFLGVGYRYKLENHSHKLSWFRIVRR